MKLLRTCTDGLCWALPRRGLNPGKVTRLARVLALAGVVLALTAAPRAQAQPALQERASNARAAFEGVPVAVAPANGTKLVEMAALLRWTNAPGTTQYHLQVVPANGDGPGIDLIVGDDAQVAAQAFNVPAPVLGKGPYVLLPDMTYNWRVRNTNAAASLTPDSPDWGPWMAPVAFRTPVRSSAGLRPAGPQDGGRLSSSAAALTWSNAQNDVFYYEVQVSRDPAFGGAAGRAIAPVHSALVHGGQSAPANSWSTPPLDGRSYYYWRVRPRVQGDGAPTAWSPVWSFETP